MPSEVLEEEGQALVSDKSGETEYQESMQSQINIIKARGYEFETGRTDVENMVGRRSWGLLKPCAKKLSEFVEGEI